MKPFLALVALVALGCDGSGGAADPDGGSGGNGDGDNGGDGSGAGGTTVTLTLTNRPTTNPMKFSFLVAYQDGSAAWQLAPAPTGDTYSLPINAPSYGVMFACIGSIPGNMGGATQRSVTTAHFAVGERTAVTLDVPARCTDRIADGVMLSGSITNRPAGGVLVVQYAGRSAYVGTQTGNFSLNVPAGTHDLVITHVVPEGNGDFYVDETLVQRDVAITANTTRSIDFAASDTTSFYTVDTSAAPSNARVVASTTLYSGNGTVAQLVREAQNWETDALADGQQRATDVYEQTIAVSTLGAGATVTHLTSQPAEQTYEAPAALGAVQTTVPTKLPYVTLQTTWPAYADAIGYLWNATQQNSCSGSGACTTVWSAYLSPGVVGTQPAYRMPDLSGLAGWGDAYPLSASPIVGSVTAMTSSAGAGDFPTPSGVPAAGTDRRFVRSDYGVSP